jgi:hypothetical protein
MPADLRELADTKAVFEQLGFETMDHHGDLVITCYDNKSGQEEVFFAAAAPFIEDGEYEWTGEDGAFWEWTFVEGKMYQRDGIREYGEEREISVPGLHREQVEMMERIEASFGSK